MAIGTGKLKRVVQDVRAAILNALDVKTGRRNIDRRDVLTFTKTRDLERSVGGNDSWRRLLSHTGVRNTAPCRS